ncbi:MAG: glucosidase [Gemmataceae bacterium]|nr:glucosidase [Gemmataceae bacterium]
MEEDRLGQQPWRRWGPYLSERQWGTVREDYSPDGDAWNYFPHAHARSRAYRWGEDGLAGISDEQQRLCLALALWNGKDPILKERLFGLTNGQGNHGEDVKELYYYLDATPTHAYLKLLYKYPQHEFPYARLIEENARRSRNEPEFELLDTGIFDDNRYFDVFVEYAKAGPDDLLMRATAHNRGPDNAVLHVLPQLWFRNTWSWKRDVPRPRLAAAGPATVEATHAELGRYVLHADGAPELLCCDNDTNTLRLYGVKGAGHFKDAFHHAIVSGQREAVNPTRTGTKAGFHYTLTVPAGGSVGVRLRLTESAASAPFADFDSILDQRQREADAFYADLQAGIADADSRAVQRQALAGLIWSRQFYYLNMREWRRGDPAQPPPPPGRNRNRDWQHLNNADVLTMPDKWEYPYYCAWDSAFQCVALARIDPEWAKRELVLLVREWYMHPNGQLPAYEWNFSDVNPPVHAWAAYRVFQIERKGRGDAGDLPFLERVFHKLLLNFTWWVNRKDEQDRNIFQGGFLGLDNIGVFDRSAPLPTGEFISQADGTSWMAMYCLNLMRIALELALHNPVYEDIATKFFEHFLSIAEAMTHMGGGGDGDGVGVGLWDEADPFYYDQLNLPSGRLIELKVRSLVGLIPLFAVETLDQQALDRLPDFKLRLEWFLNHRPDLAALVSSWEVPGCGERRLLSLLRGHRMKQLLKRMLDETEFLSDHGVRALSRQYRDHPYTCWVGGTAHTVRYQPAESDSGLFGGNSNWRGPVWCPVNFLLIESLQKFHYYYSDDFKVECPTGSGRHLTLLEVADELSRRVVRLFLRGADGRRPVFGRHEKLQTDPHFRDYLLFHEYFDGDNGRGAGAAHQTGWTALVAQLLQPRRPE